MCKNGASRLPPCQCDAPLLEGPPTYVWGLHDSMTCSQRLVGLSDQPTPRRLRGCWLLGETNQLSTSACSGWHCRPHGFHCAKPTTPESPSGNVMTSSAVVGWSARPTNFAHSQGLLVGRQDQPTLKQTHASALALLPFKLRGDFTRASGSTRTAAGRVFMRTKGGLVKMLRPLHLRCRILPLWITSCAARV